MTYRESYMRCRTLKELNKMVNKDVKWALGFDNDDVEIIKSAAYSVCKKKKWWGLNER